MSEQRITTPGIITTSVSTLPLRTPLLNLELDQSASPSSIANLLAIDTAVGQAALGNSGSVSPIPSSVALRDSSGNLAANQFNGSALGLTGLTSNQITNALGFTPYNTSNTAGYITSSALSSYAVLNSSPTFTGSITCSSIITSGASITSNTIPVTSLNVTGTASSSTYLRGDGSWNTAPGAVPSAISYTATGGSTSSSLQSILDTSGVNVISFGAIPNNLTFDQSSAFNNAIAYAVAHGIGKVIVPCGYYACNILITQNGVLLECGQPQDWYIPKAYLTAWTLSSPVIQVGNDTGFVYGVSLNNVCLNGSGPNGQGTLGLFLGGGCNGINISNFSCENFTSAGLLIGGSTNYQVEYINFANCNFAGHYTQAYTSIITVNAGTGSVWTSAVYLSNCNLIGNTYGTYSILLNSSSLIWNGGWLQIGLNGITITGSGGGISGSGTQIEYAAAGAALVVPSATNVCVSSYISGNITINTLDLLKDSNGVTHAINQPGLGPNCEIGMFCHHIGLQYFTGYNGNGASSTDTTMYLSGGYNSTGSFDMGNNIGTSVNTRLRSDGSFLVMSSGGTQMVVSPVSSATNWFAVQGSNGGAVQIGTANNSESGSIGLNIVTQGGGAVQISGHTILATSSAVTSHTSAAPTGTTLTTAVMMAIGGTITPVNSTRVEVTICGMLSNTTAGDGATVDLRYGTGTAPINGAAVTGTLLGLSIGPIISSVAAQKTPFTITYSATGLTIATAYWIDCSLMAVTGGTASVSNISISATEI
jgi:hypothetical protein